MRKLLARTICILSLAFCAATGLRAQTAVLDSAATTALEAKLDQYFLALELQPIEVKIQECDFLVESCTDESVRQHVALYIYAHYLQPRIMGEEAVAVHMVDDWFDPGKVKMVDDLDLLNAKVFAMFNRNSLVGKKAPALTLYTGEGKEASIPSENKPCVLFFYDVTCAKCKLQTILLRSFLPEVHFPIDFYAIYTGTNRSEWEQYQQERWSIETDGVTIHHLWDPELESNFQMEYGVLETPQMILVDKDGTIVGRKLDVDALGKLLDTVKPYEYGNSSSVSFYEGLFQDGEPDAANLLETAAYLKERTLASGDSTLCKHLLGDFFYFLSDAQGEEYKLALLPFISIYIDGDPGMWNDEEDQKAIVIPAQMEKDLLSRVPVGSRIPALKVMARVKDAKNAGAELEGIKLKKVRLRAAKGSPAYLIFHTPGCSSCAEVARAAEGMINSAPRTKFIFVEPTQDMLDVFDLSVLPHIIELDRKGYVTRKYLTLK